MKERVARTKKDLTKPLTRTVKSGVSLRYTLPLIAGYGKRYTLYIIHYKTLF